MSNRGEPYDPDDAQFMADLTEALMPAQAEAMDAVFCPVSLTYEGLPAVYCDCTRDHAGSHTGMRPDGSWVNWFGN